MEGMAETTESTVEHFVPPPMYAPGENATARDTSGSTAFSTA